MTITSRIYRKLKKTIYRLRFNYWLYKRFSSPLEYLRYRQGTSQTPVKCWAPKVPVPLLCRPRTSDVNALWSTFFLSYHLPSKQLPENAIIVDLGANVGYTAVDFAVRYPSARIIAVEMDAANVELAQRNLHAFSQRCTVVHAAIWSHDGEIAYGGTAAWALRVGTITGQDTLINRKAPALTMPTLLDRFGLDRIDFLKIDIEGAEAEILQPETQWLSRVDRLNLEVHWPATLSECEAILQASGFAVTRHARFGHCLEAYRPTARR